MKQILIALLVACLVLSTALVEISPALAQENPMPPQSPETSWQPPDESGQSVEPSVTVEPYSQGSSGLQIAPMTVPPPGGAGSLMNAYLVNSHGQEVSNLYGNESLYLIASFNGPGYFYLWEYYPYGAMPYGHWLCYRWYRPYPGTWRIGPFVAQAFDPAGRYTWRMWFLSEPSWSTRLLSFNYIRGRYPPDIPDITPPVYNPATINSFSASKSTIQTGETVVLTWTTTNASSVNISPGMGTVAASGSTTVTPSATTTFTLSASGQSGGTVSSTATITVMPRVSPVLSISQPTIRSGEAAYLSWNAPGATRVFITGLGSVNSSSGSTQVSPGQATTYTLTAYYIDGTSQSASATVNVEQPPYLLWGLIALLALAVVVIAVLAARRPAKVRQAQPAQTQARHVTQPEDTDTEDTDLATTPVLEAAPAKLSLTGGNDILLAGNARSLGRRDFEEFMPNSQISYISRQHINIWSEKGEYYIEDRSSTNGTRVNGVDIKGTGRHVLADGDVIELAGKLSLNFSKTK